VLVTACPLARNVLLSSDCLCGSYVSRCACCLYHWPQSHERSAPIAWPTAKLLDYVLGAHEENTYKKAELRSFLQFHRQGEEPLRDDEIAILNGVLSLNEQKVTDIMTPMEVRC